MTYDDWGCPYFRKHPCVANVCFVLRDWTQCSATKNIIVWVAGWQGWTSDLVTASTRTKRRISKSPSWFQDADEHLEGAKRGRRLQFNRLAALRAWKPFHVMALHVWQSNHLIPNRCILRLKQGKLEGRIVWFCRANHINVHVGIRWNWHELATVIGLGLLQGRTCNTYRTS